MNSTRAVGEGHDQAIAVSLCVGGGGVGNLLASCVSEVNTKRLPRVEVSFPGSEPTENPAPAVSASALVAPPVEAKAPASDGQPYDAPAHKTCYSWGVNSI
jgi:hypothetical protein